MFPKMSPSTYILAVLMLSAVSATPPLHTKPGEAVVPAQERNFSGVDHSHKRENATTAHGQGHPTAAGAPTPGLAHRTEEGTPSSSGSLMERTEATTGVEDQSNKTNGTQPQELFAPLITDVESVTMEGNYTWQSPDGVFFLVTYTEDEDEGLVSKYTKLTPGDPLTQQQPGGKQRQDLSGSAALSLIGR